MSGAENVEGFQKWRLSIDGKIEFWNPNDGKWYPKSEQSQPPSKQVTLVEGAEISRRSCENPQGLDSPPVPEGSPSLLVLGRVLQPHVAAEPLSPPPSLTEIKAKRISHVGDSEGYPEDSYPSGGTDEPEEDSEGNPKDMDSAESDDEPEGEQV